ncbi:hypothetical protein ACP4OV_026886 [Aristida adscensionis]
MVPSWIGGDLQYLRRLVLCVNELTTEGARALGELPSLVFLTLEAKPLCRGSTVLKFDAMGFRSLQYLDLKFHETVTAPHLCFEAGVMPNLQTLWLSYNCIPGWSGPVPVGMEHLLNLLEIHVSGISHPREAIGRAFLEAIQTHTSSLALHVNGWRWTHTERGTTGAS